MLDIVWLTVWPTVPAAMSWLLGIGCMPAFTCLVAVVGSALSRRWTAVSPLFFRFLPFCDALDPVIVLVNGMLAALGGRQQHKCTTCMQSRDARDPLTPAVVGHVCHLSRCITVPVPAHHAREYPRACTVAVRGAVMCWPPSAQGHETSRMRSGMYVLQYLVRRRWAAWLRPRTALLECKYLAFSLHPST